MTDQDMPLHVRVATVLGAQTKFYEAGSKIETPTNSTCWIIINSSEWRLVDGTQVPRYDTDWAATGSLIEKYVFMLTRNVMEDGWQAVGMDRLGIGMSLGENPLLAVCDLILNMKAAGKLDTAQKSSIDEAPR